jgi:hypothetical protein
LDPDLPPALAARLHRTIAALGRSLHVAQAALDRQQAQPLSSPPDRSQSDGPRGPSADRPPAQDQARPPPADPAPTGRASRTETSQQNPMHQKPQPAGLLDEDQAAREQDYDALARFVSRRMTPEQSVLDAWTLAAADAGEATITTRLLDPAAAQGAATRGAASGLRR